MTNYNTLYHALGSADNVRAYTEALALVLTRAKKGLPHNPILASIAECLSDKGYLSRRQIDYSIMLLQQEGLYEQHKKS